MSTTSSEHTTFITDGGDDDGGSSTRENENMRVETLRKRKERERVVPPAPKRQWLRPPMPSSLPPPREVDMSALEFLFEKRLKHSDVKDRGRVVIPKEYALRHFPQLDSKEGMYLSMDDVTSPKLWTFRYGFWSNHNGRIYVLEHACEFFAIHGVQNGDFLMFYIDRQVGRFAIGSRKANVHPVRDDHHPPVGSELASVATTSSTDGINVPSAVEDDSLAYFPMELLDDDILDLPTIN